MALDILVRKIRNIERNPSCVEQAFKGRRGQRGDIGDGMMGVKKRSIKSRKRLFSSLNNLILGNEFRGKNGMA